MKTKVGFLAGNFDVIHPGYIRMFRDAKSVCDKLIVGLHTDPTIERPHKLKPILSTYERTETLLELRSVDDVVCYDTEADLVNLLKDLKPDVRILGTDYKGTRFTGDELGIDIYYHSRDPFWSTTRFKKLIAESLR